METSHQDYLLTGYALDVSPKRMLRSGMSCPVGKFYDVDAYLPSLRRWVPGYRALTTFNSHAIIGRGTQIIRHPLCWLRLKKMPERIETDSNPDGSATVDSGDSPIVVEQAREVPYFPAFPLPQSDPSRGSSSDPTIVLVAAGDIIAENMDSTPPISR